jgi:6-phosphofructokinase 1
MKGNVLITQSGGPTAVMNASCCGVIQEALKHEGQIQEIYGAINGTIGILQEDLIDLKKEDPATIELLKYTPASAMGSCRYKLTEKGYGRVLDVLRIHNIGYCFFIGGNDTMDTACKVDLLTKKYGYGMEVMGIPKTVDNDLVGTDHCPGYPSVARWLAIAVRDAGLDTKATYTSDTVKIIETMGRDSGWITAATALARDESNETPHLIYLPERPFDEAKFLVDVKRIYDKLGYVVITVCEGLKDKEGRTIVESKATADVDAFGHPQRGGIAEYLCKLIQTNFSIKARFDKPGTIQRVSAVCASQVDIQEAHLVGEMAVVHAIQGKSGHMVTLEREPGKKYKCNTGLIKLEQVANATKTVPDEFINEEGNDVTPAFLEWLRPLVKPELPQYAYLRKFKVEKKLGME